MALVCLGRVMHCTECPSSFDVSLGVTKCIFPVKKLLQKSMLVNPTVWPVCAESAVKHQSTN